MTLESFLKLVEIQTKVASIIPFSVGALYTLYRFKTFNLKNFLIMFVSLITFDMATTAINNYYDYKKAKKKYGYGYESHNAIVSYGLKESTVLAVIFTLLGIAAIFGFLLFLNTNVIILLLGAVSFMIGILYSFGPIPISRTPFGELFSGLFMGFIIVFISVYIHVYDKNIILLSYNSGILGLNVNIMEVIYIFLISIPTIDCIANIMLANNICDIEDDIENKRYTLPIYVGKQKALSIYKWLYYIVYIDLIVLVALRVEPIIGALAILTFFPVNKNIKLFYEKQTKKDTFVLTIKNFIIISVVHLITLGVGTIIK